MDETEIPSDAPQTYEAADASATPLILAPDEVPGGGWGRGGPVAFDDFRQVVCGVDVEPQAPAGAFIARRLHASGAPLYETVRPVGATQANAVVEALRVAVAAPRIDERVKDGVTVTYAIEPVPVRGDAVAYRQQRIDVREHVWAFLVYFAVRDCLVVFTAFSTTAEPPVEFLDALVDAVRAKGEGVQIGES